MDSFATFFHQPWVYWGLVTIYGVTILSVVGVVLSENRNPVKSLAWVTVLLIVPVVGLVLYIFFGRNIKNKRLVTKRARRKTRSPKVPQGKAPHEVLQPETLQVVKLGNTLVGAQCYPGNDAKIFTSGAEKFDALKRDMLEAKRSIHLQYYIFEDDKIGREVAEILKQKAREGLDVRVIYDHVGCIGVKNRFFREMRDAGVDVHPFMKVAFRSFSTRANWRNHRKLVTIDDRICFIGGIIIADRYISGLRPGEVWRDTHMRITGPAVGALQSTFALDWVFMGQPAPVTIPSDEPEITGSASMQMIASGPNSQWSNVAMMMLKAIGSAKKRVYLQTPYFLPTESLLKALEAAALAKVDVRIMMPRRSDSVMLRYSSYSYISECLRAGIKVYLYEPGMLHSKSLLIDDEISTIGSTNFDFRSFEHNFEGNMMVYSRKFGERMAEIFLKDQGECSRVYLAQWKRRPVTQKAVESFMRLFSPIL